MNQNNRVLSRKGARELTREESGQVVGGIRTLTVCSVFNGQVDGDVSECQ